MPLPHTLSGILGFILFSAFIVGNVIQSDVSNDIQQYQLNMISSMELITQNEGFFGFLVGNFSLLLNTIAVLFTSLVLFLNVIPKLPPQFVIMGVLVSIGFIVALLKFARGVWDR